VKRVIYVDVEKCLACRSCEIQCAVVHSVTKNLLGALREEPRPLPRVQVEAAEEMALPLQCRHCEDAPCVTVCPSGALKKLGPEQPVIFEEERCIGCMTCVLACPFGLIRPDRGHAVVKCDFCIERQEQGEEPACVAACPTGSIQVRSLDEVVRETRKRAAQSVLVTFKTGKDAEAEQGARGRPAEAGEPEEPK
jgi:carbon-monoxide dehydrogenase iron sulfur subunit